MAGPGLKCMLFLGFWLFLFMHSWLKINYTQFTNYWSFSKHLISSILDWLLLNCCWILIRISEKNNTTSFWKRCNSSSLFSWAIYNFEQAYKKEYQYLWHQTDSYANVFITILMTLIWYHKHCYFYVLTWSNSNYVTRYYVRIAFFFSRRW